MTFVMTRLDKIMPGFNSCFIVRYLLEKASNTEIAISLLMELPIASNCNILLADKNGKMVVVECTPTQKRVREAVTSDNGSIVCAVNSFTSDEYAPYDDAKGLQSAVLTRKSNCLQQAQEERNMGIFDKLKSTSPQTINIATQSTGSRSETFTFANFRKALPSFRHFPRQAWIRRIKRRH